METAKVSRTVPGTSDPWTLQAWRDYYELPSEQRNQRGLFNILSYEVTGTPLGELVDPPEIVRFACIFCHVGASQMFTLFFMWLSFDRKLDWVSVAFPKGGASRPNLLRYCLMSPTGCFTVSLFVWYPSAYKLV